MVLDEKEKVILMGASGRVNEHHTACNKECSDMKSKSFNRFATLAGVIVLVALLLPSQSHGITYEYDSLNRLTHVAYDDGSHLYYKYDAAGNIIQVGPTNDPTRVAAPLKFANRLDQNYPNPFNPITTIRYSIRERSHVTLKIYNVAGQLVKTLVNEVQQPLVEGYRITWDGINNTGNSVASGVYFYRLVAKDFVKTKKMVLLR